MWLAALRAFPVLTRCIAPRRCRGLADLVVAVAEVVCGLSDDDGASCVSSQEPPAVVRTVISLDAAVVSWVRARRRYGAASRTAGVVSPQAGSQLATDNRPSSVATP